MLTILIFTTFPDAELARTAIHALVGEGLVACGTMIKEVESVYTWKGAIETSQETVVLLKAPAGSYEAIEQRLRQLHPYEVPEVIAVDITRGLPAYLGWIQESCAEVQAGFRPKEPGAKE